MWSEKHVYQYQMSKLCPYCEVFSSSLLGSLSTEFLWNRTKYLYSTCSDFFRYVYMLPGGEDT